MNLEEAKDSVLGEDMGMVDNSELFITAWL